MDESNLYVKRVVATKPGLTLRLPGLWSELLKTYKALWTVPNTDQQARILKKQGFKSWATFLVVGGEQVTLPLLVTSQLQTSEILGLLVMQQTL
jgi:hypothetical protein